MSDSGSFMPRMLQELVKKLEETVMILKLENQNLQIEKGILQGRVNMLQAKHDGDILLLQEQLKNAIIEADMAKQSFEKKTAELDAKFKAAETGRRVAEEELAEWKEGLETEHLKKLYKEVVGKKSEDDDSASGSAEFERVHQVFENPKVGLPLGIEIIDLTQADDDDGKESDTTRVIGDVGVDQAAFGLRDTFKKEPGCNEENTENNDVSNNGNTVDVPDSGRRDAAEVGIGNCDVIITEQPSPIVGVYKAEIKEEPDCDEEYSENNGDNVDIPGTNRGDHDEIGNNCDAIINEQPAQMVSITSVALDRFSFQMDTNENAVSNINEETSPGTISKVVCSTFRPAKSKAIIHERVYLRGRRGISCRCGKWYPKKDNIRFKRHLKYYNIRRFFCDKCKELFPCGSRYKKHLLRKHNATMVGGSFCCGECGGQFVSRSLLMKHQYKKHNHLKSFGRRRRGRVIDASNPK